MPGNSTQISQVRTVRVHVDDNTNHYSYDLRQIQDREAELHPNSPFIHSID